MLVHGELQLDLGRRRLRLTTHRTGYTDNDPTVQDAAGRTMAAAMAQFGFSEQEVWPPNDAITQDTW